MLTTKVGEDPEFDLAGQVVALSDIFPVDKNAQKGQQLNLVFTPKTPEDVYLDQMYLEMWAK